VYHVIARLNIGGPAIHVSLLAARMPRGYDPLVLTGTVGPTEGDMTYYARQQGVEPLVLAGMGRDLHPARDLALVWRLYRIFRAEKPLIVHTHTAKAGAVGRIAAWLARVPVIVHTFHGHVLRGYFGRFAAWMFALVERMLAPRTDCIITLGEHQRDEILAMGIGRPDQVVAMPLGMDLERYLALARHPGALQRRLGLPPDAVLVGIVARLVRIKGHGIFLEAAARLAQRVARVHFIVAGDGELRGSLERRIGELSLAGRVHVLGWQRDLESVYADLSCAVLSSLNEGLPTALIEAQAAGVPVVATRVGSVAEIVEDGVTGFLVPAEDAGGLARRIEQVLADPAEAARLGERARERVRARFGVDRLIADVDRLYSSLLREKGLGDR
jgi:glycosyltransferase involved in cell wall biosynthesis